ncbi:hypothetical protein TRFO_17269 [Tritrichomonas foetus]|uniref:Uncharacterized protein n=1 Tax=Tritrichomonas foetus TaxID=1144522 RepID=A0A1J4KPG0_9EUKA|nr:hypothetical protein TRFO_17269 [Tritrichomonas foetus]|eukprot:OHT12800.1 hypothetical protein TRFO_17269 [Tritrichomonas foetus]
MPPRYTSQPSSKAATRLPTRNTSEPPHSISKEFDNSPQQTSRDSDSSNQGVKNPHTDGQKSDLPIPQIQTGSARSADDNEKSKDFLEARNNLQSVTFDDLAQILKTKNPQLREKLKNNNNFDEISKLANIYGFLADFIPIVKVATFYSPDKKTPFIENLKKINSLDDNNVIKNFVSLSKDFQSILNKLAPIYNVEIFVKIFIEKFAKICTVVRNIAQLISTKQNSEYLNSQLDNVQASFTKLVIHFQMLLYSQKIRTVLHFISQLGNTQSDVTKFLIESDSSTNEIMNQVTESFDFISKGILYFKFALILKQLAEISNQINSQIGNSNYKEKVLQHNEIYYSIHGKQNQINSIGNEVSDRFHFKIVSNTEFLFSYTNLMKLISPQITKDELIAALHQFREKSPKYEIEASFFKLYYYCRRIELSAASILLFTKTEPFDQSSLIQKLYIALKVFVNRFKKLSGQAVTINALIELIYPLLGNIKSACDENKLKSVYASSAAFHEIRKYTSLFHDEVVIIKDTILVVHQLNQLIRKLQLEEIVMPFIFEESFYKPPNVFDQFDNSKIINNEINLAYLSVIKEIHSELQEHGLNFLPETFNPPNFTDDLFAPDINNAFKVLVNYAGFDPIREIIKGPSNLDIFEVIHTIYIDIIESARKSLHLKEALLVWVLSYFYLLSLSASGAIDFSNALHLMYFKSYISIVFNSKFYGNISLTHEFDPTMHNYFQSMVDRFEKNNEMRRNLYEITHTRFYLEQFITNMFKNKSNVLHSHCEAFTAVCRWFIDPTFEGNEKFMNVASMKLMNDLTNINAPQIQLTLNPIINSILAMQVQYTQRKKISLLSSYICSFIGCNPNKDQFIGFHTFFPVWYNALEHLIDTGIINCDLTLLENVYRSTKEQIFENIQKLVPTFIINYQKVFKSLVKHSLSVGNQQFCGIVDIITRGGFSHENIVNLIIFLLQNKDNIKKVKFTHLITEVISLSYLYIVLRGHDQMNDYLGFSMLAQLNLREFIISYMNGFLYLIGNLNLDKVSIQVILTNFKKLERHSSEMVINSLVSDDNLNEISLLIQNSHRIFLKLDTSEIQHKIDQLITSIPIQIVANTLKAAKDEVFQFQSNNIKNNTQRLQNNYFQQNTQAGTPMNTVMNSQLNAQINLQNNLQVSQIFNRRSIPDFDEHENTINEIIHFINILSLHRCMSFDKDSFVHFITFRLPYAKLIIPFALIPLSPIHLNESNQNPLPLRYALDTTGANFAKLRLNLQSFVADTAIAKKLPQIEIDTPTTQLPLPVQQEVLNLFYEIQKDTVFDISIPDDKKILIDKLTHRRKELEKYCLKISRAREEKLASSSYMKYIIESNEPFENLKKDYERLANAVDSHISITESSRIMMKDVHSINYDYSSKSELLKQLEYENKGLALSNKMINDSIECFQNHLKSNENIKTILTYQDIISNDPMNQRTNAIFDTPVHGNEHEHENVNINMSANDNGKENLDENNINLLEPLTMPQFIIPDINNYLFNLNQEIESSPPPSEFSDSPTQKRRKNHYLPDQVQKLTQSTWEIMTADDIEKINRASRGWAKLNEESMTSTNKERNQTIALSSIDDDSQPISLTSGNKIEQLNEQKNDYKRRIIVAAGIASEITSKC